MLAVDAAAAALGFTLLVLFLLLAAAAPAAAFYLTGSFLLATAGALAVGLLDLVLFYAVLIIIKCFKILVYCLLLILE